MCVCTVTVAVRACCGPSCGFTRAVRACMLACTNTVAVSMNRVLPPFCPERLATRASRGETASSCRRARESRDTSVCYASSVVSRVYRERHAVTYPSDDDGDKVTLICMRRERRFYVERAHDVPRVWRAHTVHRDARPRGARVKTAELLRKCVRCLGEIFRENKWRGRRRPKHGPKAGWRLAAAGARASWLAVRVRARSGLLLRLFL